jgi:ammonium transporter
MYQMMLAIITPALIIGAIAERIKFSALLIFVGAWMFIVYFHLAHMVWGINGLMNGVWNAGAAIKAIDFAGGTVVHMSSGWSALILCMILGKRLGFGKEPMPPHSMVLCMVGTGMLWVGWYGFNAGSAVAADGVAANAFLTTTLATGVAAFVWAVAEYFDKGKASVLGFCSGAVAGLVVVTPATGFINATGSIVIGVAAGLVPWFFCTRVKRWFGYDDALDTFGVHAVGGTLGAFLTGVLATAEVNANLNTNLKDIVGKTLVAEQCKAMALTLVLSVVGTTVIFRVIEPKMARTQDTDIILFSEDEVINYLKKLASSLDIHYELDDALLNENYGKAETLINEMLHDYHVKMKEPLAEIKNIIDTFNGVIAIKATNTDDIENVRSLSSRYDLALLHPENWVVVESDGINGQDWLHSWLRQFQISESKEASLLYFAQKIVVGEYKKELIVHTNSVEPETDLTAPVLVDAALDLVLVRPVVHATRFEIVR